MLHQNAHEKLFDKGGVNSIQGALAALRRPVPTIIEYPNAAAREYADIAVRNLRHVVGMQNSWPPFMVQGLRLLVLQRIFQSRHLPLPLEMEALLREIRTTAEITETLKRAGLTI